MDVALKSPATSFFQLNKKPNTRSFIRFPCQRLAVPSTRFTPMAAVSTTQTVGLSETFRRLKKQGKTSLLSLVGYGNGAGVNDSEIPRGEKRGVGVDYFMYLNGPRR